MNLLFPYFMWLLPALAIPVIIHLLNLVRYRRMRWAAIEFLLVSEHHIVRRARLKQILLMLLRISILAALLFALAAPLIGGGLAALLGTRADSVAIAIDNSMSMTTVSLGGTALDRAKREASNLLKSLPRGTSVAAAAFTRDWNCSYSEPVVDPEGIAKFIAALSPTSAGTYIPAALENATEIIQKGGRDGAICIITDFRSNGWVQTNDAVWESLRQRMHKANVKKIVLVDVGAPVAFNASITSVKADPPILLPGWRINLETTIAWVGELPKGFSATLFVDGQAFDSRIIDTTGQISTGGEVPRGQAQCTFFLPPLTSDIHTGYIEIPADGLASDNRFYFLLRTTGTVPVLVVEGPENKKTGQRPAEFLAKALSAGGKGFFTPRVIPSSRLTAKTLGGNRAVFFADVERLSEEALAAVKSYVVSGGMAVFFLGPQSDVQWWNSLAGKEGDEGAGRFAPLLLVEEARTKRDKPFRLGWADLRYPVTAPLEKEGMGSISIVRYFRAKQAEGAQMFISLENSDPYLCARQVGRGKVVAFVTSCQEDDSNLPFTHIMLTLVHRLMFDHLRVDAEMLARQAESELYATLSDEPSLQIIYPSGRRARVSADDSGTQRITFSKTTEAGFYHIADPRNSGDEKDNKGEILAAVNPPPDESNMDTIDADEVRRLLEGFDVDIISASGPAGEKPLGVMEARAGLSFFLAALALLFLVGESILAWSIGRQGGDRN